MSAQQVKIEWQVVVVEQYSMTIPADELTVAALPEAVTYPEATTPHLESFLAEREGSAHGHLTSELVSRTVIGVTFEEDFERDPMQTDQLQAG